MEGILQNAGWRDKKEEPYRHNHQLFVAHGRAQQVQSEDTVAYLYISRGILHNLPYKSILDDNLWCTPLEDQYQDILDHTPCIG
jgi:hypothetical protein